MNDPVLIAGLIFLALFIVGFLQSPWMKGMRGERRVDRALRAHLALRDYHVFGDLILPALNGVTQIDHVVVSRHGVFVIETKNMKGWIFGSADQAQWTQVIYRSKTYFQNPIRQNFKHLKAVENALGISTNKTHGVVVFVGSASAKTNMPSGVIWSLRDLVEYIKSKTTPLLSEEEVSAAAQILAGRGMKATAGGRRAHVRQLKARSHTRLLGPAGCSRCGAEMVERTNRQTGESFLACKRYPDCRSTRPL